MYRKNVFLNPGQSINIIHFQDQFGVARSQAAMAIWYARLLHSAVPRIINPSSRKRPEISCVHA